MSIKSDRWIRRMAKEHRMIEPFVEGQVREGVISYGVSSYGYDVRIADEFKIFTNINSTIVDPKQFDPRSFVDFKGDVCIIPPNSFALARTVEYFRIPRNVLTVCLGKCVSGETRVMDAGSGQLRRIDAVVGGAGRTASLSRSRLGWHDFSAGVAQGVLPVVEVVTRTGRRLRATPNHPLLTFEGWRALQDLGPGARIAVPREVPVFGDGDLPDWQLDLLGLMISDGQCRTPGSSPAYTSADPVLHEVFARATTSFGCVPRRVTRLVQRASNRAGRGGRMEPNRLARWLASFGLDAGSPEKFVPDAIFGLRRERLARFLRALYSGDGGVCVSGDAIHLEYCSTSERLARDVHHLLLRFGITAFLRHRDTASGRGAWVLSVTSRDQVRRFAQRVGFVPGCRKQRRLEEAVALIEIRPQQKSNFDTLPSGAWSLIGDLCRARGTSLRGMGVMRTMPRQSVPMALARDLAERLGDEMLGDLVDSDLLWDSIVSKRFAGVEPVYDLTLPETHNFVADDVLVHNSTYARCGIIVNVTPFEPEWEGIVTLEVSNTTPLPAKIYANEGIAQVLFFESDEECETSYADKKGKYQAQRDLTLPRL